MKRQPPQVRHAVTVEIAGEKHVIRTDQPEAYTRSVAAHVEATLRQVSPSLPIDPHRAAILAAMVITDELFRAREELDEAREEMEARAEALAVRLQRAIEDTSQG
jgi:cell division protein ZapA